MPTFIIDDREIEARDGETVLQAALRHGIDIPHFCWHDKLSVAGNCRMCLVKVNGMAKLQPSCNLVAGPKMTIETTAPEVQRAREQVLQFVLLNHPVDCGICDKAGECRLQDYQHRFGPDVSRSRDAKHAKRKLHVLSERISLDNERCILCSRCVRFTREISGSNALGIVERGHHAYVESVGGRPFDDPYSDNVIGLCPTGALLSRDFLYQCRVWFLEPVRSACTGCARACGVQAWRRKKERLPRMPGVERPGVYRITPAAPEAIGGGWLCNTGFDLHKAMARERLPEARIDGRGVPTAEALARARALLAEARRPAVLASTHASNEEVDAFVAHLGPRVTAYPHADRTPAPGEVVEDAFLIRADKNPNRRGVVARIGERSFDPAAGHDLVLVWGDVMQALPFAGTPWIHLAPFGTPEVEPATVVVPISTTFERSGSFDNFAGERSVFDAVLDKPAHVVHAADAFARLAP